MVIPVPTLSATGWATDIAERADRLVAYYFTSERSQSYSFYGDITSLTEHLQNNGTQADRLREQVQRDLQRYLGRYFAVVEINVRTDLPHPDYPEQINLIISCHVGDGDGTMHSLGRLIETQNDQVVKIMEHNNQ